mmetsp:Transcript_20897/g.59674  ORF Transcript_20897/g.59674 Transcript_20897/m.59674 type:complete len:80 (+) Transcript_20897:64-303(+)
MVSCAALAPFGWMRILRLRRFCSIFGGIDGSWFLSPGGRINGIGCTLAERDKLVRAAQIKLASTSGSDGNSSCSVSFLP